MDKTEKKDNQIWKVVGACGMSAIGFVCVCKMNPEQIAEVSMKFFDTLEKVLLR